MTHICSTCLQKIYLLTLFFLHHTELNKNSRAEFGGGFCEKSAPFSEMENRSPIYQHECGKINRTYMKSWNAWRKEDMFSTKTLHKPRDSAMMSRQRRKALVSAARNRVGMSLCLLARLFGILHSYVREILPEEGITYQKRSKAPEVNPGQLKTQSQPRRLARGRLKFSLGTEVIMDH